MRQYSKVASLCIAFLLVLSLPALAGSVNDFSNVQLKGVSSPAVSGSFTFSDSNGNWISEGVKVTESHVSSYVISEGSFSDDLDGGFSGDEGHHHGCGHRKDCHQVPEGGAEATYLMLSGIAVFAGMLVSGKQRRTARAPKYN
jgi:hypothetical protein